MRLPAHTHTTHLEPRLIKGSAHPLVHAPVGASHSGFCRKTFNPVPVAALPSGFVLTAKYGQIRADPAVNYRDVYGITWRVLRTAKTPCPVWRRCDLSCRASRRLVCLRKERDGGRVGGS